MTFKALIPAFLLVSVLAGCGAAPGQLAQPRQMAQAQAASDKGTLLYGAFFLATVRRVDADAEGGLKLTLDVRRDAETRSDYSGKLVVRFFPQDEDAPRVRVGDVVTGFANYPTVDMKARRFVNLPGKAPIVFDLKVRQR